MLGRWIKRNVSSCWNFLWNTKFKTKFHNITISNQRNHVGIPQTYRAAGTSGHRCLFQGKVESVRFWTKQFSGHLIFDKKTFFSEKNCFFISINKNFVFLKKKTMFFFFLKKNVFSKKLKKFLTNFLWTEKF